MRKFVSILLMQVCVVCAVAQQVAVDYSYCGYRQSEAPIPDVPVVVTVKPGPGDRSSELQAAIAAVSARKPDKKTGMRGAVLLQAGIYEIAQPLHISASGVVLRGADKRQTVLRKTGVARGAAVYVEGRGGRQVTDTIPVVGAVGLNQRELTLARALPAGTTVQVWHQSTQAWIDQLGCSTFGGGKDLGYWGWHPGEEDVFWSRTVTRANGRVATLDAPLSMYLPQAKVLCVTWCGQIADCGVENLTIESAYDVRNPKDEDHCWDGIYIDHARDCWVRQVDFRHLAGSAVVIQRMGSRITVEDCISRAPVSEVGGYRRRTFHTLGELCLFQRCYSEQGIHDFSAGHCAAGPNAFVQCDSKESLGFSGSVGPWATGLLFDCVNIDGNDLRLMNLGIAKYGAGWNTANSLLYQSTAAGIFCYSPDSLQRNQAYGCWAQFEGDGEIAESNNHVKPWSIFADLLAKRLGRDVSQQCRVLERNTGASSSPTIDEAQQMTAEARLPRLTMEEWIEQAPPVTEANPVKSGNPINLTSPKSSTTPIIPNNPITFSLTGNKLTANGALLVGGRHNSPWWNGRDREPAIAKATYAVTRFVPGREGRGATDRIDSVVAEMKATHTLLYSQNYGLWYDRRRDDHERVRRRDGDVWPPFYEQPFARSGEGTAWDGLSRYDLTRLNSWYYDRLNEFAGKAAQQGLLLVNEHYFQHNILEAGAHWVDCPWRSANNINDSDLPEPVPFTGDKRVFMAEQFYDVSHPQRRALHRQYIRQTLDAFAGHPNVIHSIGEEFTGPLAFVRFWLDVVAEWENETGHKAVVALAVNKDVQDSIMADPRYARVVNIIDIEQWYYHSKGLYAPPGGVNMAPRQYLRKIKTGTVRFEDIYQTVRTCREQYPGKAVIYSAPRYPEMAWAVLLAGASCAAVPVTDQAFLVDAAKMDRSTNDGGCYMLSGEQVGAVAYVADDAATASIAVAPGTYQLSQVDGKTGTVQLLRKDVKVGGSRFTLPGKGIYWLKRTK